MAGETLILCTRVELARRRVCGLGLLERAALAARQAGFQQVLVAAPEEEHGRLRRSFIPHVKLPECPPLLDLSALLERGAALLPECPEELVLASGDRVWVPALLKDMVAPLAPGAQLALSANAQGVPEKEEEHAGLLRVRSGDLAEAATALSGGLNPLREWLRGRSAPAREHRPAHGRFELVRREREVRAAETVLLRSLVKDADGIISRNINRRISLSVSRILARLPVQPNYITAVVLLLGLASGPFAAQGTYWGFVIGGFLYYLGAILDGCDGEISRLKYLGSPLGAWLDSVTDDLSALSFLSGLYFGLQGSSGWTGWWILGGVAVLGNVTTVATYYRLMIREKTGNYQHISARFDEPPVTRLDHVIDWLKRTIFRTDFLPFAAFVTCLVGLPQIFAFPYPAGAVATAASAIRLSVMVAREKRAA